MCYTRIELRQEIGFISITKAVITTLVSLEASKCIGGVDRLQVYVAWVQPYYITHQNICFYSCMLLTPWMDICFLSLMAFEESYSTAYITLSLCTALQYPDIHVCNLPFVYGKCCSFLLLSLGFGFNRSSFALQW